MKIGLVCPYHLGRFGGVQRQVLEWSKRLQGLGHESLILTPGPKVDLKRKDLVFFGDHIPVPTNATISTLSFYLENGKSLKKFLKKEKFDILHFHAPLAPFLSWQLLAASQTVNVATFHAFREMSAFLKTLGWSVKTLVRPRFTKKVKKISAVSPAAAALAGKLVGEIEVIPNAIDLERFSGAKKIEKFADQKINLLHVGALSKRKGVIYLLRSIKKLAKENDNFRLILVGSGPEKRRLKAYVKLHRLKNVVFAGLVTNKQLPSYYASADIFCAPATRGESFGIVLLEAMASGLPIVAFANEGYKYILRNKPFCDFMAEPKDVTGFSQRLEKLIVDKDLRKKLAGAGLKEAQKYSWERVGKRILKFYGEALGGGD